MFVGPTGYRPSYDFLLLHFSFFFFFPPLTLQQPNDGGHGHGGHVRGGYERGGRGHGHGL